MGDLGVKRYETIFVKSSSGNWWRGGGGKGFLGFKGDTFGKEASVGAKMRRLLSQRGGGGGGVGESTMMAECGHWALFG